MDERELANHVLEIVDQTAYRGAARQVIGVHLAVGGRRGSRGRGSPRGRGRRQGLRELTQRHTKGPSPLTW